jgi:hypothetical protein
VRPHFSERGAHALVDTISALRLRARRPPRPPRQYPQRHLTAVLRVPATTAGAIVERVEPVRARWPDLRWYPASTLHVTVLNLNDARGDLRDLVGFVRAAARGVRPLTVYYDRFGLSPDSGLLWVTASAELTQLRDTLRAQAGIIVPRGPAGAVFRAVAFANVVRFDAPPHPHMLRAWRHLPAMAMTDVLPTVDLVSTDRYLSQDATEVLARVQFGSGDLVE